MNNNKKFFGICIKQCEILSRISSNREVLRHGDLIRILELGCQPKSDKIIIKLYDADNNAFKTDLFECAKQNVDYIVEELWGHLIGVHENYIRIRIYNDRKFVLQLKCDTEITIKTFEDDPEANIKGVINLIGGVIDVGIGCFIGIRLLKPPLNRNTYRTLYKKHYNQITALLLFRIDQLLDALKEAEHKKLRQSGNEIIKNNNGTSITYPLSLYPKTNTNNETQPRHVINTDKQTQNEYYLNIFSYATDNCVLEKEKTGTVAKDLINIQNQKSFYTELKTLKISVPNGCKQAVGVITKQEIIDKVSGSNDNEILMRCIDKSCDGKWFVSKTESSPIFKCPLCEMYNCVKCKTIHRNQTCAEHQNTTFRKWNCKLCTYENNISLSVCTMCLLPNSN